MSNKVDIRSLFSATEVQYFEELRKVNDEIKALEAQKQNIVGLVKTLMQSKNITAGELDDASFSLVKASRRTIAKGQKDSFIADLVANNAKHLITYSIEPDLDGIFAEVDAGTLDKSLVDKYVKVTDYYTLRCS